MAGSKLTMLFALCVIMAPIVSGSQLSGIEQTAVTDTSAVSEAADRFPEPLPEPTPTELEATTPIPATKTRLYNSHGVWAFPGIIGPLGVMSQRSKQKSDLPLGQRQREYRVLSVDKGSPAHGRLLPGDVIIGLDGGLFKPGKYVNKAVAAQIDGRWTWRTRQDGSSGARTCPESSPFPPNPTPSESACPSTRNHIPYQ